MAQLVTSPLSKPYVTLLQVLMSYSVKRAHSGRVRRVTEALEPETDFGHHYKQARSPAAVVSAPMHVHEYLFRRLCLIINGI